MLIDLAALALIAAAAFRGWILGPLLSLGHLLLVVVSLFIAYYAGYEAALFHFDKTQIEPSNALLLWFFITFSGAWVILSWLVYGRTEEFRTAAPDHSVGGAALGALLGALRGVLYAYVALMGMTFVFLTSGKLALPYDQSRAAVFADQRSLLFHRLDDMNAYIAEHYEDWSPEDEGGHFMRLGTRSPGADER